MNQDLFLRFPKRKMLQITITGVVSLLSKASKMFTRILLRKKPQRATDQTLNKGRTEQAFEKEDLVRTKEKQRTASRFTNLNFVDYEKAFDKGHQESLCKT